MMIKTISITVLIFTLVCFIIILVKSRNEERKAKRVRRKIYNLMKIEMEKKPECNYTDDSNHFIDTQYVCGFCHLLYLVDKNHNYFASKNRIWSIDNLPELIKHKPEKTYAYNRPYWFHPYDKITRMKIINQIV